MLQLSQPAEVPCSCLYADLYMLRRFLRARSHDLAKAKAMFLAHLQWRKEFGADDLDKFEFTERDAVISVYPQGYHKVDKQVLCTHLESCT